MEMKFFTILSFGADNGKDKPKTIDNGGAQTAAPAALPAAPPAARSAPAQAPPQAAQSCKVQSQLAAGIQQNIDIQAKELQGVMALQFLAAAPTANATGGNNANACFASAQKSVLAIQAQGIKVREANQKLATELKSPSIAGLDIVSKAQVQEAAQVQSLKGDAGRDNATLEALVKEVQDGTAQNQRNLADAVKGGCVV
ncbi:hypothetical protein BCR34DRAFT_637784 [Clohesyomyces aquaticus]|uniref:Uncharacterized protein n=1 Tax=Clohesyomyces aquaticus TaxID=1231657 RepID=A0A1Y1YSC8_9PLEO|nr:hypothetical protein BCR34DRAFT_637784 [Clohesyomyces aquaticus]